MKHLRQYKRLWLVLLALVTGSLHMQTVYACSEMGERLQMACCCDVDDSTRSDEAESREPALQQAAQACCEITYSSVFDDEALFSPAAQPGKSAAALLALPPYVPAVAPIGTGIRIGNAALSFDSGVPSPIYLSTRRLRI